VKREFVSTDLAQLLMLKDGFETNRQFLNYLVISSVCLVKL